MITQALSAEEFTTHLADSDDLAENELRSHVAGRHEEIWRAVEDEEQAYVTARRRWRRLRPLGWVLIAALTVLVLAFGALVAAVTLDSVFPEVLHLDGKLVTLLLVATLVGSWAFEWLEKQRTRTSDAGHMATTTFMRLEEELYVRGVAPVMRDLFPQAEWALTMRAGPAPGLADLASVRFEVPTRSSEGLGALLRDLRSGAIGVAGARGAGKTTLIDSVCAGRTQVFEHGHVGVRVSAPVRYDARDFVVHLLARACEVVIDDPELLTRLRNDSLRELMSRDRRRRLLLLSTLTTLFATAALLSGLDVHVTDQTGRTLVLGGLALLLAFVAWDYMTHGRRPRLTPLPLRRPPTFTGSTFMRALKQVGWIYVMVFRRALGLLHDPVRERALTLYVDTKLQQSYSSGWSGSLDLPLGGGLGAESNMTWAQVPMTLPDLVAQLRDFLQYVTESRGVPVIVGIDELDKMQSTEEAHAFLNGIKSIFGVPGVYFLVSVSQDAMSGFERRGLPFRDVFDSSFDEVVEARYLGLDETGHLLRRRVVGMPTSFHALCHCLSGAVPRDVIRVARSVIAEVRGTESRPGDGHLASVATQLVRAELRSKCRATAIAVGGCAERDGRPAALGYVATVEALAEEEDGLDARALLATANGFGGTAAGRLESSDGQRGAHASPADLAAELNAFVRYCAVVLLLFGEGVTSTSLSEANGRGAFELLAKARQGFVLDPTVASMRLDAVCAPGMALAGEAPPA